MLSNCGGRTPRQPGFGMPDVIAASRLADGLVVFLVKDGSWTEDFNRAAVYADKSATDEAIARAQGDEAANVVVEPYAVPVEERNGHVAPKSLREAIRAAGPTVRRDLGKQAHGQAPHGGPTAVVEAEHVSL